MVVCGPRDASWGTFADLRAKTAWSPILPPNANFCSNEPPPIWFSSDGLAFYFIWLDCLPQLSIANTGDIPPHCTMAAESTQGDTHDKAWEKAEKKFTQYVSSFFPPPFFCLCLFPKHVMTFLKSFVVADHLYMDYGVLRTTRASPTVAYSLGWIRVAFIHTGS